MKVFLLCITIFYFFIDFIPIKREKFCKPLKEIKINDGFGYIRKNNIRHYGIDLQASIGTEVFSSTNGNIEFLYDNRRGHYVVIERAPYKFIYAHLQPHKDKSKTTVSCGEKIGKSGSSGLSFGPHLHFEAFVSHININPTLLEYYK